MICRPRSAAPPGAGNPWRGRTRGSARFASCSLEVQRVQELVQRGALPQQELDNARSAAETARADVAALGAQLRGSRVQLGYYQVTAPGHGVVGDIPVRVGDTVTPAMQVTSVADIAVLEANVAIPVGRARDVGLDQDRLRVGADLRRDEPYLARGERLAGVVDDPDLGAELDARRSSRQARAMRGTPKSRSSAGLA